MSQRHFAALVEADVGFRLDPTIESDGLAALRVSEERAELQIFLRGLRPLRDTRAPGHYVYEAWLLDPAAPREQAISLSAFNSDETGTARCYALFDPLDVYGSGRSWRRDMMIVVTAEGQDDDPTPGSSWVLLGVFGEPAPLPQIVSLRQGAAQDGAGPNGANEAAAPAENAPDVAEAITGQPESDRMALEAAPDAGPGAEPEVFVEASPTRPESATYGQPWDFTPVVPPPAVPPPGYHLVEATHEALTPLQERLRGATGNVLIQFNTGECQLTIRGVPTPPSWGFAPSTGRPCNVYEGWLCNSRTGEYASLGYFRRIWNDTYRLQYRGDLPLHLFDTVLVSPEDRAGMADPNRLPLFRARYLPFARTPRERPAATAGR